MTDEEVKRKINEAIKKLKEEERTLDFENVHERTTAHRLAVHMEEFFPDWDIDCEYDRDGHIQKELAGISECDDRKTDRVLPDIIVHKREEPKNLLIIELKKSSGQDPCDHKKLELFTDETGKFKYKLGLYLNINGGACNCTWFKNGQII